MYWFVNLDSNSKNRGFLFSRFRFKPKAEELNGREHVLVGYRPESGLRGSSLQTGVSV